MGVAMSHDDRGISELCLSWGCGELFFFSSVDDERVDVCILDFHPGKWLALGVFFGLIFAGFPPDDGGVMECNPPRPPKGGESGQVDSQNEKRNPDDF